jgi:hypothetical protein
VPARRAPSAPPPLTDDDVALMRARLADGETPRVVVRAASAAVAAGTRGSVIRLGDPKDSEYVVVRLGRDEVPFAPTELGLPGKVARTPTVKTEAVARTSTPARGSSPARRSAAKSEAPAARKVPPMTVVMRFRDGAWTVEAQRGARRLAKPVVLRPGAVSAFAEHLDDDSVREALVETVDACRAVIEQQAAELRAMLQATEISLREYETRPGGR